MQVVAHAFDLLFTLRTACSCRKHEGSEMRGRCGLRLIGRGTAAELEKLQAEF